MSFWQWLQKKFCAHTWKTVESGGIKVFADADDKMPNHNKLWFHERCESCGANRIRTYRV